MADLGQETKIDGVFGGVAFNNQVENAVENTAENIQNAGTNCGSRGLSNRQQHGYHRWQTPLHEQILAGTGISVHRPLQAVDNKTALPKISSFCPEFPVW